jgi:glycine dehydrogenase subunit 1
MPFIPHTPDQVAAMLAVIGVEDIDDLFDEIPADLRAGELKGIPAALPEMEVGRLMAARARADGQPLCFIGAGAYEHHIPAAVWQTRRAGRTLQRLHPLPGRGQPGHPADSSTNTRP